MDRNGHFNLSSDRTAPSSSSFDRRIGALLGVANRTIGYALAGLISAAIAQKQSRTTLLFGVGMGVAIGAISALVGVIAPNIEQWADGFPARRLGLFGTAPDF